MKIRLERGGTVFEYERQPMKESRFRVLCALAGAGVYSGHGSRHNGAVRWLWLAAGAAWYSAGGYGG